MPVLSLGEWDKFLKQFPNAHLLQTTNWGRLKSEFSWDIVRIAERTAGAQIFFKRSLNFSIAYIPKGPVGDGWDSLISSIHKECKKRRAIILIIEPDQWESEADNYSQTLMNKNGLEGFHAGNQSIQPRRTIVIDLKKEDNQILSVMKQKTRYNIHLASKKGVQVKLSSDLAIFNDLIEKTGKRDNFAVHKANYYETVYKLFAPKDDCALMIAEYDGEPLAGLMVFKQGSRAWYFYGASSDQHREMMPAYLLQWEAIKWAKNQGCDTYDLWGVPDKDEKYLEENFSSVDQGLWGVYRFKRGFGGELKRSVGPIEYDYQPTLCKVYRYLKNRRGFE
jgi:peptidoglycan pentaglycine glycine transferase (the first glycine)